MNIVQRARVVLYTAGLALLPALTGCHGVPYLFHLAEGQLQVQGDVESIDGVLQSGRLAPDKASKLRLIVLARDYAANHMGLNAGDSYTTFYDTSGDPLAWSLSAARRDALVPRTWALPVVGEVPYLSFFDEDYLRRTEQRLLDDGYDTMSYELDAYSTLGVFADPVRSPMLNRDSLSLVETVIHELLHNTVWRNGQTVFNESLATFVGRQGAIEFLRTKYADDTGWPGAAQRYYDDVDTVNVFLRELYDELRSYYAQDRSSEDKIAGRDAVYQAGRDRFVSQVLPTLNYPASFVGYASLPTNNAWMLAHYRYNLDLDVFARVYAACGQDWHAALAIYQAAAADSGNPFTYLRNWLAANGG